jgi:2-polyprenyl-3-methyl-5-hydroxy-6-metoxy-1,4-benzoquinol methylase
MSDENWQEIRKLIDGQGIELGPYFGHQIRNSPRHILFTLARYKFAARMLPQDRTVSVLELGCSEGIGTLLLGESGHRVTAVDADEQAIAHANRVLQKPNLSFKSANFVGQKFGTFDAVVSLDVIEHIERKDEDAYAKTITDNLTPEGMCVLGTPNDSASQYASKASQIGHVNMFVAERFTQLLRKHFVHVFMFGMNDEMVHTGFYPMCHYLMAVACMPRRG